MIQISLNSSRSALHISSAHSKFLQSLLTDQLGALRVEPGSMGTCMHGALQAVFTPQFRIRASVLDERGLIVHLQSSSFLCEHTRGEFEDRERWNSQRDH